jgi:hypothetical protein
MSGGDASIGEGRWWYQLPPKARALVTDGMRGARDEILAGLAAGLYPDVKGAWADPKMVASIYNAALLQLGAEP